MFAIRDERDYTVQEDFMKVGGTLRPSSQSAITAGGILRILNWYP